MGCCVSFAHAQEEKTDNESYGALVDYDPWMSGWYMGDRRSARADPDSLPPIKFCPWCGKRLMPPAEKGGSHDPA